MTKTSLSLGLLGAALLLCLYTGPAQAQATRTWVSGVGDDVNPCSRTAPCKTYAGAISKTATGGEINCLDPGGFGALTITKSISVVCDYTEGGVLSAGTTGFIINIAVAGSIVTLKGQDIECVGTGVNGINIIGAGSIVHIHKTQIRNCRGGGSGIVVAPSSGNHEVYVADSYITDNGTGTTTGGITIRPTVAATANLTVNRTQIENNFVGIIADGASSTGPAINVVLRDSLVSGSANNGITATTTAGHAAIVGMIQNTAVTGNAGTGISANGAASSGLGSAIIRVGGSVIAHNVAGLNSSGLGQVRSYTTNQVNDNLAGETFAGNDPPK